MRFDEHNEFVEQRLTLRMKRHREKYARALGTGAWRKIYYRRVSWNIVADRIERHFSVAARCSKKQNWFEYLYVHRDDDRRTVQLAFGQHPAYLLGPDEVESGATLVISQNVLGGIIVLFYPFETNTVKRSKPRVIWNVLSGPEELSEGMLLKIIDQFLIYSKVSSVLLGNTRCDTWRVSLLENRSRLIEGSAGGMPLWGATVVTLIIGSLATAGIYLAWALDNSKDWLAPYAGLTALVTGWFAFAVQRGRDAVDEARAREDAEKADQARNRKLDNSE